MANRNSSISGLAIALLLGVAGFLGNWFNLQLFFNVDFLFGSFFVMLAVARYGVAVALTAGVIAGSSSYFLWHHPWAIIIFTAEALFVSLLNRRQPGKLVILDTLFWLCLGMPLVWLFYRVVMGMDAEVTQFVALKQSINGIFNALFATVVIYCVQLVSRAGKGKRQLIPLSQLVFTAMVAVSIIPSFVSVVLGVNGEVRAMEKDLLRRVNSIADSSRDILNVWISSNQQSVISLAQLVGDPNTAPFAHMQQHTEALIMANPALLRLMVANSRAKSVAFAPLVDVTGKSTLGIDFSYRPFIAELLRLRKPLVSDLEVARVGPPVPRLAFVAPVIKDDEYRGFCAGVVNLDRLAEQLTILAKNRFAEITILDRRGRVVVSSSDRWQPMQQFGRPAGGEVQKFDDGSYHWIPGPGKMTSTMQRWRSSLFVKEIKLNEELPWNIVVEGSLIPYLNQVNQKTIDEFMLLWEQIILTIVVSYLISKGFVGSLQRLETITMELPHTIATNTNPNWPETRIGELSNLVGNFRQMAEALGDHIRKLNDLNKELESFCYSISHEMRAPIARLEGFSKMLIESDTLSDPDTHVHCVERIEAASRQLRAVIDSLLMMNRLSRAEMTSSPVDLSGMAQQIVDELRREVGLRPMTVTIAPNIVARGDRQMLEICLRNLLENAVKYTSKKPDAAIEFGQMQKAGENVYYVRDNGAGFDMAFANKLFKPFSRLHNDSEFEGSGIGLATVQRIIERHGGSIWAEASPDAGATFWFTLGESMDPGHSDFDFPGV